MSGAELTDFQVGKQRADSKLRVSTSTPSQLIWSVWIGALLNLDQRPWKLWLTVPNTEHFKARNPVVVPRFYTPRGTTENGSAESK